MAHSLSYCADIVAELANRREPLWHDRLKRRTRYDKEKLREIAMRATRASILGDGAMMDVIESGILAHEMEWQIEWALRGGHVAGHA